MPITTGAGIGQTVPHEKIARVKSEIVGPMTLSIVAALVTILCYSPLRPKCQVALAKFRLVFRGGPQSRAGKYVSNISKQFSSDLIPTIFQPGDFISAR